MPPSQLQLPLSLLVGSAILFYGGTHLLWRALGTHRPIFPFLRGVVLAIPMVLIACWLTWQGRSGLGVSVLLTGSVIMLTLALGVSAMSAPDEQGLASTSLRLLIPVCTAVFLAGLSGELGLWHAMLIAIIACAMPFTQPIAAAASERRIETKSFGLAILGMLGGTIILTLAVNRLVQLPIVPLIAPVIVPLAVLASVGLLVGDVHARSGAAAVDTVVGCVVTMLGAGLPFLIIVGTLAAPHLLKIAPDNPALVLMPLANWRIDSVLLVVLAGMLFPAGMGKGSLGRVEGMFLVMVCVFFMIVSVFAARSA